MDGSCSSRASFTISLYTQAFSSEPISGNRSRRYRAIASAASSESSTPKSGRSSVVISCGGMYKRQSGCTGGESRVDEGEGIECTPMRGQRRVGMDNSARWRQ